MAENKHENENSASTENNSNEKNYPSLSLALEACEKEYFRVFNDYAGFYGKLNIAIVFAGVLLAIVLNNLDFTTTASVVNKLTYGEITLRVVEIISQYLGLAFLVWAILWLLLLIKGKPKAVLRSEVVVDERLYRETKENFKLWLMRNYAKNTTLNRPVVEHAQKSFNRAMTCVIVGLVLYAVSSIIQKGGV